MNAFALVVRDSEHALEVGDVESFVGRDESGSFGIQAHAEGLLAVLAFGLSRFRTADGAWHYLAFPGALLVFEDNTLTITATRFLSGDDLEQMSPAIESESLESASVIRSTKQAVAHLEQALMRKLVDMSRASALP